MILLLLLLIDRFHILLCFVHQESFFSPNSEVNALLFFSSLIFLRAENTKIKLTFIQCFYIKVFVKDKEKKWQTALLKILHHKYLRNKSKNALIRIKICSRKYFICLIICFCRKNIWNKNCSWELCTIQDTSFKIPQMFFLLFMHLHTYNFLP